MSSLQRSRDTGRFLISSDIPKLHPGSFDTVWKKLRSALAAQIGAGIGWHTFRHTYSSLLRQLGVDVKVQQELLRHADAGTTMNLYTRAVSAQKRAAHSSVVRLVLPLAEIGEGQPIGHFWTRTKS